jgi:hypothetical protein
MYHFIFYDILLMKTVLSHHLFSELIDIDHDDPKLKHYLDFCKTNIFPQTIDHPHHPMEQLESELDSLALFTEQTSPSDSIHSTLQKIISEKKSLTPSALRSTTKTTKTKDPHQLPADYLIYDPNDELGVYPASYACLLEISSDYLECPISTLERLIAAYEHRLFCN